MSTQRIALASFVSLSILVGSLSAQAPRPKFGPAAIAEAENKLRQARCALHHQELPPLTPDGPPQKGPIEVVAFPVDVNDNDITKLMVHVLKLPGVTTLSFTDCTKLTEKGLKEAIKLDDVKALYLDGCTIDAACLRLLKPLKQLQWLDVSRTPLRDNDFMSFEDFPMLMHLSADQLPNLNSEGVAHLQQAKRLRSLQLTVENDQNGMLKEVGKLTGLLELKVQPVSDSETKYIAQLSKLQVLDINANTAVWFGRRGMLKQRAANVVKPNVGVRPALRGFTVHQVTEKGFPNILQCTDLRVLRVAGHPLNVAGSGLEKLEFLQELDLSGTNIEDDGISYLGKLRGLKNLALSGTPVTNRGVRELSACGSLETVALDDLPITDEAIRYLAQNRKIKELSLNATRIACNDRSAWALFPRLERLELRETNVTDSSIMVLGRLRTLKFVDLRMNCPNVTWDGAQALRRELPQTTVRANTCEGTYWVGGGGVPIAKRPNLDYKVPNVRPGTIQTNQPPIAMKEPPAPAPVIKAPPVGLGTGKPK